MKSIVIKTFRYLRLAASAALGVFALYTAFTGLKVDSVQRGIVLGLVLIIVYSKDIGEENGSALIRVIHFILMIAGAYASFYQAANYKNLAVSLGALSPFEVAVGIAMVVSLLEATRTKIGWPVVIISGLFIVYALFGNHLTGLASHRGYSLQRLTAHLWNGTNGIFGTPLGTASGMVVMFILFGAFLEASGGTAFFMDIAISLTGKSTGGPAKAAVVSSALMGTISGNAASNVVTTGTFTIPLMKKTGYRSEVAGAVEAVASTGGQIMPPVMGAAAFIMAETMGTSYSSIALAAVIPAVLYYVSVFLMVHLEAKKNRIGCLDDSDIPDFKSSWKNNWHTLIAIAALIYALVAGYSTIKSALIALIAAIVCSYFRRHTAITPEKFFNALISAASNAVPVVIACSCAGIIIGCVTLTGLGLKLSSLIITVSGGHLLLALVLTFITLFILGMGMPTAAAYITVATLVAPGLVQMGLSQMSAHMFCLYGAVLSAITPPVALAAYAASGIAEANPVKIGFTACKFGAVAFIVPFFFAYQPALLCIGSAAEIILTFISAVIGTAVMASGIQGYFRREMKLPFRILAVAGALALIYPGQISDILGIVLSAVALIPQFINKQPEG